jgi:hypothetical protein
MAAVPYVTLDDVLRNVQFQLEVSVGLAGASAVIEAYRLANAGFLSNPLSVDEINGSLKNLTGCTVATGTDMNCYPRGDVDVSCFDLSGNPIP